MSKYGMSLSAFGLAAELKGLVAVNALWPKTAVWTAAMNMLGGEESRKGSRKPSILADAAYAIACRDKSVSGNFYIDEELLREEGIKDFEQYAEYPGHPLLPDFFLPDRVLKDFDPELLRFLTQQVVAKNSGKDSVKTGDVSSGDGPVAAVFAAASGAVTDDIKDHLNATLHFVVSDKNWTLVSKKGSPLQVINDKPESPMVQLL